MLLSQGIDAALAGVAGLMLGSFLNVVIYRLPAMMYRDWLAESVGNLVPVDRGPTLWQLVFGSEQLAPKQLEHSASEAAGAIAALPPLSLSAPRSRCGVCGHAIPWYENIPVLSYLILRCRCSACNARISIRYPMVELCTAGLFALCAWRFGMTPVGALWSAFAAMLVCQFLIDLDTQLLPDTLNYPLMWLGLVGAALGWTDVSLGMAVWGSVFGYLSLWGVYHLFRLATGKQGMGFGDFKLLAALGAWLGADFLVAIILIASLVGSVLGLTLLFVGKIAHKDIPISFGPFLAGAGLVCLVFGPEAIRHWLPLAFPFNRL